MCSSRNSRRISIQGRNIRVDGCMKDLILDLNEHEIKTLACCCGHGKYQQTIIVTDGKRIYEFFTDTTIPRKRNFYRTDTDGFYYLPEISTPRGKYRGGEYILLISWGLDKKRAMKGYIALIKAIHKGCGQIQCECSNREGWEKSCYSIIYPKDFEEDIMPLIRKMKFKEGDVWIAQRII